MPDYLIITGGSRGIGEQTIAIFQEKGWTAVNISRTPCPLPNVINFNLDLSSFKNIEKNAVELQELVSDASSISLVHNAAYYKRDAIPSLSPHELELTLQTNVISAAALNTLFIPAMKPGSSIIYIGSTLSEKAVPGSASYVISKHAVVGLMRSTCQDLIGKHIHTCCICPGFVNTQILKDNINPAFIQNLVKAKVIAKRLIEPDEIANVIYFCATSPVINGTLLHANLGQVAD